jgi:hypothetical protein
MPARGSYAIQVERNVPARMRDGTVLRADQYRPRGTGAFPILLMRTPYDKARDTTVDQAERAASFGYLVAIQDVRGRFASDGDFRPGFYRADTHDAADGYDTVEWAARLPDSNGKVGTFGTSYAGWTQWELAHTRPPHLVAMFAGGIAANLLDRELSGVLRTGRVVWWTINTLAPDTRVRQPAFLGPRHPGEAEQLWQTSDRSKWLWYLPLSEIPDDVLAGVKPHFLHWLENHTTDFFTFAEKHAQINVPVYSVTGWYDQQIGTITQYTGMVQHGMTIGRRMWRWHGRRSLTTRNTRRTSSCRSFPADPRGVERMPHATVEPDPMVVGRVPRGAPRGSGALADGPGRGPRGGARLSPNVTAAQELRAAGVWGKGQGRDPDAAAGGVALVDEHIALVRCLQDEGDCDLCCTTTDSYTRNEQFGEAQRAIEESRRAGRSLLNGLPVVNHGVQEIRRVVEAVDRPLILLSGTARPRLTAEVALAAGFTAFLGGCISYTMSYTKDLPIEVGIRNYQYLDRLAAHYREHGCPIHREQPGFLTGTLVPPGLAVAIAAIEAVLGARQGLDH